MNTVSYINLLDTLKRSRNIFVALVFILTQIFVPLSFSTEVVNAGNHGNDNANNNKQLICHATNSASNPYTNPTVNHSAIDGDENNDHSHHTGPAFNPDVHNQSNRGWGDIIPPVEGIIDNGLNWYLENGEPDEYAQAIYNNGCKLVDSGAVRVDKRLDDNNNGQFTAANDQDFMWQIGDNTEEYDMGHTLDGVTPGLYDINETNIGSSYRFVSWFYAEDDSQSCLEPEDTSLPTNVEVQPQEAVNVTFCNERIPAATASLTIEKEVTEGSDEEEEFPFTVASNTETIGTFDLAGGESNDDNDDLEPGTYTITESLAKLQDWTLEGVDCGDHETTEVESGVTLTLEEDDNVTCVFTNDEEDEPDDEFFTLRAHKVVCDTEELLPNWGGGTPGEMADNKPSTVDADTASDYASRTDGCEVETDWGFQWGHYRGQNNKDEGVHKLSGDHVGEATEDDALSGCFNCGPNTGTSNNKDDPNTWKNFDNSDGSVTATIPYTEGMGGVWVREVLKEGYVPFTLPPEDTLNNESAELYCHQDVAKYDNLDLVANPQPDQTYHCVAFNAEKDDPRITVNKVTNPEEFDQDFDFTLDGGELTTLNASSNSSETFVREPGDYSLAEVGNVPGWELVDAECSYQNERSAPFDPRETDITLELEDNVECTFVNERLTTITVLKDANPQGSQEFNFTVRNVPDQVRAVTSRQLAEDLMTQISESSDDLYEESFSLVDDGLSNEDAWTDEVEPGRYLITEDLPIGWTLNDVTCDGVEEFNRDGSSIALDIAEYQQVECTFDNSLDDLVLELDKENDTPDPATVGEVVTYTLTLEIPEDSGVSYNTRVVDIAPENFAVNNASAQAQLVTPSPFRTTAFAYSGNPNYASPGTWELGTLYPGDVVELTYEATILEEVTPGTYPDIAYAQGGTVPLEERNDTKYSNIDGERNADEPFVGTAVTVETEGEVLGATTLAATGAPVTWQHLAIPILLIGLAASLVRRETKGAL